MQAYRTTIASPPPGKETGWSGLVRGGCALPRTYAANRLFRHGGPVGPRTDESLLCRPRSPSEEAQRGPCFPAVGPVVPTGAQVARRCRLTALASPDVPPVLTVVERPVLASGTYQVSRDVTERFLDALPDIALVPATALRNPVMTFLAAEVGNDGSAPQVLTDRQPDIALVATFRGLALFRVPALWSAGRGMKKGLRCSWDRPREEAWRAVRQCPRTREAHARTPLRLVLLEAGESVRAVRERLSHADPSRTPRSVRAPRAQRSRTNPERDWRGAQAGPR